MGRKRSAGFSLVEVVVAITILTAIVIPMFSAFYSSFALNARTEREMQAQEAVTSVLEGLLATGIPVTPPATVTAPNGQTVTMDYDGPKAAAGVSGTYYDVTAYVLGAGGEHIAELTTSIRRAEP